MPRVSVVLPCYNGARFLRASLDSVLAQTFPDWELIIVDDCSTDGSGEIADEYATRDARIRVVHNSVNRKLPGALNDGFAIARGAYFTWTSDDNVAKPNWLSTLVQYLDNHPGTDMVSACMDFINEDGNTIGKLHRSPDVEYQSRLAYECNIGAAFMYRRETATRVGKYDENMFCAEDYDYWVRIGLGGKIDYIRDNIYMYRRNSGSLTATQQERIWAKTLAIKKKYKDQWLQKLELNWWQRKKLEYLVRNPYCKSEFSICGAIHTLGRQFANTVFFWSPNMRHRLKNKLKIQL